MLNYIGLTNQVDSWQSARKWIELFLLVNDCMLSSDRKALFWLTTCLVGLCWTGTRHGRVVQ